jgi:glycosyltransferase involved in cell wall biosynthesis
MTEPRLLNILVPRCIDTNNVNAQNLNAKALLARFKQPNVRWHCWHFNTPDPAVIANPQVSAIKLPSHRFWPYAAIWQYQRSYDAIFYPGNEAFDARALALRQLRGQQLPTLCTLEGMPGDAAREQLLRERTGWQVQCFRPRSGPAWTTHHDAVRTHASVHIAISPYLATLGRCLYPGPWAVLPLGVDGSLFNTSARQGYAERPLVLGAGTLYENKQPQFFLTLAKQNPQAEFCWLGDGPMRQSLLSEAQQQGLNNLQFPGGCSQAELTQHMQRASLFVLPSLSEGVPKVTQEAAACGLPVVLFNYYQAPVLMNGETGYAVSTNEELFQRVSELLNDPAKLARFGAASAALAKAWDWDKVAAQWEALIVAHVQQPKRTA